MRLQNKLMSCLYIELFTFVLFLNIDADTEVSFIQQINPKHRDFHTVNTVIELEMHIDQM